MNRYSDIIQALGPNNLQWSEDEQKYLLLSHLETLELVNKCVDSGVKETDDIMVVVRAYEDMLTAQIIFRNFLNGDLNLRVVDKEMLWSSK
jgi:hypothetical protein